MQFHYFSLGPLVCKVKDHQVEVIVDTLCNNMVGDKEQLRDISSIGLKTVINELPLTTQTLAATGKENRKLSKMTSVKVNVCLLFSKLTNFSFQFVKSWWVNCPRLYLNKATYQFS